MSATKTILQEAADLKALGELFLNKATKLERKIQQELGPFQDRARRKSGLTSQAVQRVLSQRRANKLKKTLNSD